MAKPQLENGHTRIANEILDHLVLLYLSPNEWQVLFCIIRKTYGFHKKVDYITNKQIVTATGLGKTVVSRTLRKLQQRQLINRHGKWLGLNKDWEQWQKLAEQSTSTEPKSLLNSQPKLAKQLTEVSQTANKKLAAQTSHKRNKRNYTKETIQKKEEEQRFNIFWAAYPKKRNKGQAEKAFEKVAPDEQLMAVILLAIERAKKSAQWLKDDGQFIPYPATWLNAKGWEDELKERSQHGKQYQSPEEYIREYQRSVGADGSGYGRGQ